MSYSFNNPCYNCKKSKGENPCEDAKKIRAAMDSIHQSNDGTHQGAGEVLLMCVRIKNEYC